MLVGAALAFLLTLFGTPLAIRYLRKLRVGQEIRTDGPQAHASKRGTPTMGGIVFILASVVAYAGIHVYLAIAPCTGAPGFGDTQCSDDRSVTAGGLLLLGLFVGMGLVGFADDYIKVRKRRSLGLNKRGKIVGQLLVGVIFGALAVMLPDQKNHTVASEYISFIHDIGWLNITKFGAVLFIAFVVISTANAVNLVDGLDGLATGSSVMVLMAYSLIGYWEFRHPHVYPDVSNPLEVALVAAIVAGACFGFLWWNASPAKVFMGDTGALGLGGLIAGLAVATKTELLLIVIGALFVLIVVTEIIQIVSFRTFGRRVFRMVPLHHHFELAGWPEINIVIRFWMIAAVGVAVGVGIFYADFLRLLP
ncbi:phospho-N-acetylmuramoyl-pentapeptide-transferase [Fodinicola feengrottensis]|uniref:Phospho-N-acetylmuramoyl-pentapeptide-transferase n=1 Tax=Fodinicola feengrottensis TaxID=435914 RepID=A0ABP4TQQ0_9ACTN